VQAVQAMRVQAGRDGCLSTRVDSLDAGRPPRPPPCARPDQTEGQPHTSSTPVGTPTTALCNIAMSRRKQALALSLSRSLRPPLAVSSPRTLLCDTTYHLHLPPTTSLPRCRPVALPRHRDKYLPSIIHDSNTNTSRPLHHGTLHHATSPRPPHTVAVMSASKTRHFPPSPSGLHIGNMFACG
jgi:hypothetical protein